MNQYQEALQAAEQQGYLVTGTGKDWLAREVQWRRYCTANNLPAVVVSRRTKLADVYIYLGQVPHKDATDEELVDLVHRLAQDEIKEGRINVLRGHRGRPQLFVGLCVADLSVDEAMAMAPPFRDYARSLLTDA